MYGHVALCVSKGRLALFTDNKTKVGAGSRGRRAAGFGGEVSERLRAAPLLKLCSCAIDGAALGRAALGPCNQC